MHRGLYEPDHEAYRETVRAFLEREVVPHKDKWDEDRWIDREVYKNAAAAGQRGGAFTVIAEDGTPDEAVEALIRQRAEAKKAKKFA